MLTATPITEMSKSVFLRSLERKENGHGARHAIEGNVDGFPFTLPVAYERHNGNGHPPCEVFSVDVGGTKVEHNHLTALPDAVIDVLDSLLYASRLPRYAFHSANPEPSMLPVYPQGNGWMVHEPEGPIIKADDLDALRSHLAAYLDLPDDQLTLLTLSSELRWMLP